MKSPSRQTCVPVFLCFLTCLTNTVPGNFLRTSLVTAHQEVENFIKKSLSDNYNLMTTKESSSLIFTTLTSLSTFLAILGSYAGIHLSNHHGRKKVLFLCAPCLMLFGLGLICSAFPLNRVELLFIGRIICGLASGMSWAVNSVYIAEITPASLRGTLTSLVVVCAGLGISGAVVAGMPGLLGSPGRLPYLHLLPALFAALGPTFYWWVVESPRYLSLIEKNDKECSKALIQLGMAGEDVQQIIEEYQKEDYEKKKSDADKTCGLVEALKVPFYRATIGLSAFICISFGMSGYHGIAACLVQFLTETGMPHSEAQYFAAAAFAPVDLIICFLTPLPVHFCGRKPILFTTFTMILLSLFGIFSTNLLQVELLEAKTVSYIIGSFFLIITVFHNLGLATLTFVIPAEISPTAIRSLTSGLGFGQLSVGLSQLVFYPLFLRIGPGALIPFMLVMLCGIFVTVFLLPETKGLTVSQAIDKWRKKLDLALLDA